ncbi:MAG TPA: bifunctional 2-polyprenyl-6-hydroxyphenol methylase/3-demethylubiquinol 3-O-methyltransferase UbiG [Sphingomonas sp.]|jgi:2-polyprenyl-6-hydroxyphenyl methylase/3-demethylubiquinone-9 3-methyltransferase|nr:bifunctional 2-polyprenyl-6-hydroxyphenol methylase/3-demethylubiquinol 3-O-methyltransferase UbiG [Sphingomonas sp.]
MDATQSILPDEQARFGAMAAAWWDPRGSSAMLHKLNPARLRYIREQADRHWGLDERARRPLSDKTVLDMGCGAGLLAEPLARLGAQVTGVDAAEETIAAARAHSSGSGLNIDYRQGDAGAVAGEKFDLVTCLEVLEHVADPAAFVSQLAGLIADGGLLILSTPAKTALSRFAMISVGETIGGIPAGTHDWEKFVPPDELRAHAEAAGLRVIDQSGLSFSPARGFVLGTNMALDHFLTAVRA